MLDTTSYLCNGFFTLQYTISLERDYLSPRAIYYSSRAADDDDDNNSAKTTMQSPELQLASFHSWHVILNNVSLVAIFIIQSG